MVLAKEALESKGFELVPFYFTDEELMESNEIFLGLVANYSIEESYDRMVDHYERPMMGSTISYYMYKLNPLLKSMLVYLLHLSGNHRLAY